MSGTIGRHLVTPSRAGTTAALGTLLGTGEAGQGLRNGPGEHGVWFRARDSEGYDDWGLVPGS